MSDDNRPAPITGHFAPALRRLTEMALAVGADAASVVSIRELPVEPALVRYCLECRAYGLGAHCPPHATDPEIFRSRLSVYTHVVAFKIDVPVAVLLTDDHLVVTRRLHAIAAALEREALLLGAPDARGLASGSCKLALCGEHDTCSVLAGGPCRHPGTARSSISAFGINMFRLAERLGWPMQRVVAAGDSSPDASKNSFGDANGAADEGNGLLAGLVLMAFPPRRCIP